MGEGGSSLGPSSAVVEKEKKNRREKRAEEPIPHDGAWSQAKEEEVGRGA